MTASASGSITPPRILIVGGGGLGLVLAGRLRAGGAEVTLLVKPAQAARLSDNRVQVTGLSDIDVPLTITADPAALGDFDYLLLCVKARDTTAALAPLHGLRVDAALSLQNGVAKNGVLIEMFGAAHVLGGTTAVGGARTGPTTAVHSLAGPTLIGELDGSVSARGQRLAVAFQRGDLAAACVPDIRTQEWFKLALFLRTALVCSLIGTDLASALLDPDLLPVCARVAAEVAAVAEAEGSSLRRMPIWITPSVTFSAPFDDILADLIQGAEVLRGQGVPVMPSLAQDTLAGRPSELEETAGDVERRAARLGVPVPALSTLCALLRARPRFTTGGG